jgi:predicted nucleic acid-binding protein
MSLLVDSDILIEVSRGRNTDITARWRELSLSDTSVLYSPVTAAELWAGARPSEYATLHDLFGAIKCVPIDAATGRQAGEFLRLYRKSHALELADAMIAAAAVLSSAMLWTRNRKHYPMNELFFY